MIRLLLRLLNIRDFEVCQSCETLKQQLAYERDEKRQLTETLLMIVRPKVVESVPVELSPITTTSGLFSRRRAILEQRDREEAKILQGSKNLGRPDNVDKSQNRNQMNIKTVEQLESELGIVEGKEA